MSRKICLNNVWSALAAEITGGQMNILNLNFSNNDNVYVKSALTGEEVKKRFYAMKEKLEQEGNDSTYTYLDVLDELEETGVIFSMDIAAEIVQIEIDE